MATTKKPSGTPLANKPTGMTPQDKARAAVIPSINAAIVIESFQGNLMGQDTDLNTLAEQLRDTFKEVQHGDLLHMEAMLISQATALQTIFTSLARRASHQEHMGHYQTFLNLALKAQAQSRATISALVDLKHPRQATFVKQANIAHGPQQVNNAGTQTVGTHPHAKESSVLQNELLEDHRDGSTHLDTRATPTAARGHSTVATVEPVHRAAKRLG